MAAQRLHQRPRPLRPPHPHPHLLLPHLPRYIRHPHLHRPQPLLRHPFLRKGIAAQELYPLLKPWKPGPHRQWAPLARPRLPEDKAVSHLRPSPSRTATTATRDTFLLRLRRMTPLSSRTTASTPSSTPAPTTSPRSPWMSIPPRTRWPDALCWTATVPTPTPCESRSSSTTSTRNTPSHVEARSAFTSTAHARPSRTTRGSPAWAFRDAMCPTITAQGRDTCLRHRHFRLDGARKPAWTCPARSASSRS